MGAFPFHVQGMFCKATRHGGQRRSIPYKLLFTDDDFRVWWDGFFAVLGDARITWYAFEGARPAFVWVRPPSHSVRRPSRRQQQRWAARNINSHPPVPPISHSGGHADSDAAACSLVATPSTTLCILPGAENRVSVGVALAHRVLSRDAAVLDLAAPYTPNGMHDSPPYRLALFWGNFCLHPSLVQSRVHQALPRGYKYRGRQPTHTTTQLPNTHLVS